MTTLPQTTPIRLPRVTSSSSSALAVPNGSSGAVMTGPVVQMTAGDVWRVIRSNLWLIVLLVGVSAVGGFFLNDYLAKHYSAYSSSGLIRIRPLQPLDPLHGVAAMDSGSLEIAQQTQTQMIKSDGLIDEVLKQSDNPIRQTNWWRQTCGADPQRAHELLAKYLSVEPQIGSELIRVVVTTPEKADAPVLVSSVVEQAIQNQRTYAQNRDNADRKRIADLRQMNGIALANATHDVRTLAEDLTRDGGDIRQLTSPKDIELSRATEQNFALMHQKVIDDNGYNGLKSELDRGETPGRIEAMVNQDRDVIEIKSQLNALDDAIGMQDGLPSNPTLQQLQKRKALLENKLVNVRAERSAQLSTTMLAEMDAERTTTSQLLDASNAQVASLKQAIADLSMKYANYMGRKDEQADFQRKDDEYRDTLTQMDNKAQMADFGSLTWFVHPLEPTSPSFPKLTNTMAGAILVGLGLSLSIAFLRELTDTTVRSPRDIVRVGQMAMLGMVPHEADDPQSSGARLPLVIFEAPHSIMAEQLRQVRTRLQHAASLDTTRSILVTSPGPGDGKSTIACNLAAGLALNGRRILLIDANFRRPELHRIFGIGNEVGFGDVLNDVNTFASAVRETSVPNLSVMPSGAKPSNSTELLESQLLLDAIERALEEYDHVIFDSGPMLFVSESVALAPRVDGVVTVVRARSSSRGVLLRMRDALRQVKAEHLGIVLNGVRTQAGGYYGRSIKTYYEYQNQD